MNITENQFMYLLKSNKLTPGNQLKGNEIFIKNFLDEYFPKELQTSLDETYENYKKFIKGKSPIKPIAILVEKLEEKGAIIYARKVYGLRKRTH